MSNLKNIINENCLTKNNKIYGRNCTKEYLKKLNIYDEVMELTKFDKNIKMGHRLLLILENITDIGKCVCGNVTKFDAPRKNKYNTFCSAKCSNNSKDTKLKYTQTCLSRYNVLNGSQKDLPKELFDREFLENKNINGYSLTDIAKMLNVDLSLVSKYFKRHKIPVIIHYETRTKKRVDNCNGIHPIQKNIPYDKITYDILYHKHIENKVPCNIIAKEIGISNSFLCRHMNIIGIKPKIFSQSSYELEIITWLKSNNINNIVENDRTIIDKELDIYLPDHNIAIEFNGLYWHSNGTDINNIKSNKIRHLEKTEMCENIGIKLFHIFENEWNDKKDIWKSMILNALGKSNKIYARKCIVGEVDSSTSRTFLNNNHLQGEINGNIRLGLYHDNILISLIVIGKNRFSKNVEYELLRFCSKIGYSVIGGFSRLLKNSNINNIISYGNRRWCSKLNNVYETNNFKLSHLSNPNYYYFLNNKNILYSRNKYQKHKLDKMLNNFDNNLTEHQNMSNNGYRIIYDSGNLVYILNKETVL